MASSPDRAPETAVLRDGRPLTVRRIDQGDGEAMAAFYAAVPMSDFRFYCPHALTREAAFAQAARADEPEFLCAVGVGSAGEIAGYAWIQWDPAGDAGSFGMCVQPGWQGCGAGRRIAAWVMAAAEARAGTAAGPTRVRLTVQLANARAAALYRSLGFAVVEERMRGACRGFPPEPEYAMEAVLRGSEVQP